MKNLFEHKEEENYCKTVRVSFFFEQQSYVIQR